MTQKFTVEQRFNFVEQFAKMVINKQAMALLLTGKGGIGKTSTVKKAAAGKNVVFIKGNCTPKALYKVLFENRDKTIVFDDCDEILVNKRCFDLIKAAIDSYETRTIHWESDRASSIPNNFTFNGTIIFISNLNAEEIHAPIRTRCLNVDLAMTDKEKIERMYQILRSGEFMPEVSFNDKFEALKLIEENISTIRNMSIRSLVQTIQIKAGGNPEWKSLAMYSLMCGAQ